MDSQSGPNRNSANDSHDRGSGCCRTAGAVTDAAVGALEDALELEVEVVLDATGVEADDRAGSPPPVDAAAAAAAPPFASAPDALLAAAVVTFASLPPFPFTDEESTRAHRAVVRSAAWRASRTLQWADVRFDDSTRLASEAPN